MPTRPVRPARVTQAAVQDNRLHTGAFVWVRLTKDGEEQLFDYCSGQVPASFGYRRYDGWWCFKLSALMAVFGRRLEMDEAEPPMFVGSVIHLAEPPASA